MLFEYKQKTNSVIPTPFILKNKHDKAEGIPESINGINEV
jgi:hypothetical protein